MSGKTADPIDHPEDHEKGRDIPRVRYPEPSPSRASHARNEPPEPPEPPPPAPTSFEPRRFTTSGGPQIEWDWQDQEGQKPVSKAEHASSIPIEDRPTERLRRKDEK
jgi:hypothetical protein